ncbi:CHASE domain-containing protein [Pontibacter sp. JAM-7]|uniref:CHASE domain-containing protein n=1 Tax=Pontibacter sp. JAM-7 TaxID=3366581 RepID=UPI003AF846A7
MRLTNSNTSFRSLLWAALILVVGLVLAFLVTRQIANFQHAQAQQRFDTLADQVLGSLTGRVLKYEHGLRGMRGVVNALWPDELNYEKVLSYAASREVDREFPGSRGFGFIQKVPRNQEAAFLQAAREVGRSDFKISELNAHVHDRLVIRYIEPVTNNRQAVGLDIASENNRRTAALQAMRTGEATLTHPITLVQASGAVRHGFLLLIPTYTPGMPMATPAEREAAAFGLAYTPLLMDEILEGLDMIGQELSLTVLDIDADGSPSLFYAAGELAESQRQPSLTGQRPIHLFGRDWIVEVKALPAFFSQLNHQPPVRIFFLLALASLLLATVLYGFLELRSRKHRSLREQARMAAIIEGSNDAIIALDGARKISLFNAAAEAIFGYSESDVIGTDVEVLLPGLNLDQFISPDRALRSDKYASAQMPLRARQIDGRHRQGSTIPTEINLSVTQMDGQDTLTLIVRDITERQLLEKQLRQQNDELERRVTERTIDLERARAEAEKLSQIKSEFLANMSHEIRTPLHAVLGMVSLLRESTLQQEQRVQAETIHESAQMLLGLINDILDISKIEAGKIELEPVDFNLLSLLEGLENSYRPMAEHKGLVLTTECEVQAPLWLRSDVARIRQILTNLVGNAIKFTEQGQVQIKCQILDAGSDSVHLLFSVRDSGIGISKQQQASLFQRFQQVDGSLTRRYGGTGLGLAICRQLADLLQGNVTVSSEEGVGSTFTLELQLPRGTAAAESSDTHLDEKTFSGRVLVVDDVAANQLLASMTLRRFGLAVDVADDGLAALRQLAMFQYDLVFMDMQMPEMDGLEATRRLRSGAVAGADSRVPVVAMTANAMEGDKQRCLQAGMDDYIAKPIEPAALQRVLQQWLSGQAVKSVEPFAQPNVSLPAVAPIVALEASNSSVWDLPGLLERVMGDRNLAAKLLQAWLSEWPDMFYRLAESVDQRDAEAIAKHAHAIKGAAANLDANTVRDLALELELSGKQNQLNQADALLAQLDIAQQQFEQTARQELNL